MKAFLIVIAVLALIIIGICSLSATITVIYENGWHTKIKVLFIEKDVVITELLSFILFPERRAQKVAENNKNKKQKKKTKKENTKNTETVENNEPEQSEQPMGEGIKQAVTPVKSEPVQNASEQSKSNPVKKIWDEDGIVGIMMFVTNLLETAGSAVTTFFRGFHIYSLYVMILVGGQDADLIARSYGTVCKYYYPLKGMILNGMKVDNYDDYIRPDFIAEKTEFEMQFIGSVSVGLLLKSALKAGIVFLKNLIKNK